MALHHAAPGEVVDLCPAGEDLASARTAALVKTDAFEAVRIVLQAGAELPAHHVPGKITLQCLKGRVDVSAAGRDFQLSVGHWVYLEGGAPHSVRAVESSTLLLTILFDRSGAE